MQRPDDRLRCLSEPLVHTHSSYPPSGNIYSTHICAPVSHPNVCRSARITLMCLQPMGSSGGPMLASPTGVGASRKCSFAPRLPMQLSSTSAVRRLRTHEMARAVRARQVRRAGMQCEAPCQGVGLMSVGVRASMRACIDAYINASTKPNPPRGHRHGRGASLHELRHARAHHHPLRPQPRPCLQHGTHKPQHAPGGAGRGTPATRLWPVGSCPASEAYSRVRQGGDAKAGLAHQHARLSVLPQRRHAEEAQGQDSCGTAA